MSTACQESLKVIPIKGLKPRQKAEVSTTVYCLRLNLRGNWNSGPYFLLDWAQFVGCQVVPIKNYISNEKMIEGCLEGVRKTCLNT